MVGGGLALAWSGRSPDAPRERSVREEPGGGTRHFITHASLYRNSISDMRSDLFKGIGKSSSCFSRITPVTGCVKRTGTLKRCSKRKSSWSTSVIVIRAGTLPVRLETLHQNASPG